MQGVKPLKQSRCLKNPLSHRDVLSLLKGKWMFLQRFDFRYYEWTESPKQAHYVKSFTHQVMMLAALYDTCVNKETGELIYTYTVVTTESASELAWLHDRMPVILTEETMELWLEAPDVDLALSVLRPFEGELEAYVCPTLNLTLQLSCVE